MNESALFDLTWLVTQYQSELGVKSSGGNFESMALGIHIFSGNAHEYSAKALAAAARAGRIIDAMGRMGRQNRNVIIHSYDPLPRMPPSYLANYGDELAGVVWKVRAPKGIKGQQSIKLWAKNRLDRAHREYLEKKREVNDER